MHLSISEILRLSEGKLINYVENIDKLMINGMAPLEQATPLQLGFLMSKKLFSCLDKTQAGLIITYQVFAEHLLQLPLWQTTAIIATLHPKMAMARLSEQFALQDVRSPLFDPIALKSDVTYIHPTAVIGKNVDIKNGVTIGPHVVIGDNVKIFDECMIGAGSYIADRCSIGAQTLLFPHVTLYPDSQIGERVRIHAHVVIGADGFGYVPKITPQGPVGHQKIFHIGYVVIEDDVEIGANTCIDRGTLGETRIESMVKIDNLVQIGHNVHIKKGTIVCGKTGIAGSVTIGSFCVIAGGVGIGDHVHIGDYAQIGGMACISKDIPPHAKVLGNPQRDFMQHFKIHAMLNKMSKKS